MLLPLQSSSKKKREVERCTTIIQGLKAELAAQETNQRLVLARLEGEKEGWFSTGGGGGGVKGRGVVSGRHHQWFAEVVRNCSAWRHTVNVVSGRFG